MKKRKGIIKVNLSSPILARTRCPYCKGLPNSYFCISNKLIDFSPRNIIDTFEFFKDDIIASYQTSHYYYFSPKNFTSVTDFSHQPFYKNYRIGSHSLHKDADLINNNITEYLSCNCQQSRWGFKFKTMSGRPDIYMRKSKKSFP
jgi:hypothetical protein